MLNCRSCAPWTTEWDRDCRVVIDENEMGCSFRELDWVQTEKNINILKARNRHAKCYVSSSNYGIKIFLITSWAFWSYTTCHFGTFCAVVTQVTQPRFQGFPNSSYVKSPSFRIHFDNPYLALSSVAHDLRNYKIQRLVDIYYTFLYTFQYTQILPK